MTSVWKVISNVAAKSAMGLATTNCWQHTVGSLSQASHDIWMQQLCRFFLADVCYSRRIASRLSIAIDASMFPKSAQIFR